MTSAIQRPWTRRLIALSLLFLLALLPRLYGANTVGWNWYGPGSFTLVNFDEAGSCRAALEGFDYSTFIGRQTLAIAELLGRGPGPDVSGDARAAKAFCHNPAHLSIARNYAAVTGALTVVVIALIALMLVPGQPAVAWTAGALVALSGFHISESQTGTVDAPSVFFIYAFLASMIYAVGGPHRRVLAVTPLLLVPAIWTKYWVFALFAYLSLFPQRAWEYLSHGMSAGRVAVVVLATSIVFGLVTNSEFQASGLYPLLALYYLVIPWRRIRAPLIPLWLLVPLIAWGLTRIDIIHSYTTGGESGLFGAGYAAIGWHKWLRNPVNVPAVLIVGLGLPACLFLPAGVRAMVNDRDNRRAWLCLLPVLAFLLFMAFLAPVTYYRHYLALIPAAALLAACGLFATRWARRPWLLALFFAWPALLAWDMLADYQRDPRIALGDWYEQHASKRVFFSYYVTPPPRLGRNSRLFRPEFAFGDAAILRQADYLILSENWYDTAFANELNGPLVNVPGRLVKTRPAYAAFYRQVVAGEHPLLVEETVLELSNFMPELVVHRAFYGTFQLFVGDIRIYRVVR
jgi:hypothetical protein